MKGGSRIPRGYILAVIFCMCVCVQYMCVCVCVCVGGGNSGIIVECLLLLAGY